MPPKAKFTKEEIINAAIDIVRAHGLSTLTARALGTKLGSSARPIFTTYRNMEEVQQDVIQSAKRLYNQYIKKGLEQTVAFKGVGTAYILFAIKEPKLFQLLFMTQQSAVPDVMEVLPLLDESYEEILTSVQNLYALEESTAKWLYRHLWVYTHGIAVLCATGMCRFSETEISTMMTEVCLGLLQEAKQNKLK